MQRLRHPNVVQWIGSTSNKRDVLLIVEYMSRGSMHDLLQARVAETDEAVDQVESTQPTVIGNLIGVLFWMFCMLIFRLVYFNLIGGFDSYFSLIYFNSIGVLFLVFLMLIFH